MGISAEWGRASDTAVEVVHRGDQPFGSADAVEATAALVFDPSSGGGLVVEGSARELDAMLAAARAALAPALAAEALAEWNRYETTHAELLSSDPSGADRYEDDHLPDVAATLAAALAAQLG